MSNIDLELAKFIVKVHGDNIKKDGIHENNQTVIDWVNTQKTIIKNYKEGKNE